MNIPLTRVETSIDPKSAFSEKNVPKWMSLELKKRDPGQNL